MTRLKIRNKYYKMLNEYTIQNSSREVKFSDVTIDFSKGSIADLPLQYEEIQIIKGTQEEIESNSATIIFYGYAYTYNFSEMKKKDDKKELTISIISPMELATLRTVTLAGNYKINELLKLIIAPLTDEGFVLKECLVTEQQITVNFLMQTVEFCLNELSNTNNLFWHINELKEISVYDINYLFAQDPVLNLSHNKKTKGFLSILPSLEAVNYANVLNIKNARVYFSSYNTIFSTDEGDENIRSEYVLSEVGKTIKNGETVTLNYPIDSSRATLEKLIEENQNSDLNIEQILYTFSITYETENSYKEVKISLYKDMLSSNYVFEQSNEIGFSDETEEKEIVLQRDSFFNNLITSFKYNGSESAKIIDIRSDTALKYSTMKFYFSEEIEKMKNIVNKTGIVEKQIDMNEKWFTQRELTNTARNMINVNGTTCNVVTLVFDYNYNLKLGNIVNIDMPNFFIQGNFVVTDVSITYLKNTITQYTYELRNSSVLDNFIDIFRSSSTQENQDSINSLTISEYTESTIKETHFVTERQETTEEKALRLSKEAWINECGSLDGCIFRIETVISENYYLISVRDSETTAAMAWIYVNIVTEKVEIEF